MKKFVSGLIVGVLLFASASVFADSVGLIGQKVQGMFAIEKSGVKVADAVIINGSAFAPVRAIADATGTSLSVEGKKIIMKDSVSEKTEQPVNLDVEKKIRDLNINIDDAERGVRGQENLLDILRGAPGYNKETYSDVENTIINKMNEYKKLLDQAKRELSELQSQ